MIISILVFNHIYPNYSQLCTFFFSWASDSYAHLSTWAFHFITWKISKISLSQTVLLIFLSLVLSESLFIQGFMSQSRIIPVTSLYRSTLRITSHISAISKYIVSSITSLYIHQDSISPSRYSLCSYFLIVPFNSFAYSLILYSAVRIILLKCKKVMLLPSLNCQCLFITLLLNSNIWGLDEHVPGT